MIISGGFYGKLIGKVWFILFIIDIWGLILGVDVEFFDEVFFIKIWSFVKFYDDFGEFEGLSFNLEEFVFCVFFVMLFVYGFKF